MSESRALLLTDVVDSTQLSETLGDKAMAAVWAAHDRAARDLLPTWRGREIDKTDGMLLLFDAAADAVQYALAYHRALAALPVPLQARAGLHVGPVILRENSADDVARGAKPLEVDGLAKPTAARVMSLARGGQTLLTPEARQAVGALALPLQSHGHWVMKGVSAPVELFEAGDDPASFAAPRDSEKVYRVVRVGERWLPAREIPNNLPQQATSFIGRERELDELKAALGQSRLVTLLGMGGLGKTRLSLQVAAELMAEFPDGAWFLDLSPIRDPALVVGEAAQVLAVREEPGRPLLQTLCAHLATKRVLLVIDNCEHLIKPAAELAHALLRAAPGVRLMASSREALRVPGEQAVPILPLPVPARGDSLETLQRSTAVRLFVARAQTHKPSFELNEREAPAVAELVARLEGIPLALELAAARVRSLGVADINKRLADRYKVLTGGSRVLQERQQTLRALVDWSYEILQPEEQLVFKRLAVFAGGFDLAAAEVVCGAEPLDSLDVMDWLTSLVEKSLVMMEERPDDAGGTRYRMLETLRDYAHEKLLQDGEAPGTAARHAEHYFVVAKQVRDGMQSPEPAPSIDRAETEIDNLRGAMATALAGGVDAVIAVKLAMAVQSFWLLRGYVSEGRAAVRAALALPAVQASDRSQAWALYVGAVLALAQNDHAEARHMLETGLVLARRLGNPMEIAATLSTLAVAQLESGDARATLASETEALAIFQQIRHRQGEVIGHLHLGQCAAWLGDDKAAADWLERGLAIAREIGQPELEAECCFELGLLACEAEDAARARHWLEDARRVSHDAGNKRGEACALWGLAKVDLLAQNTAAARPRLTAALAAFRDFEMRVQMLGCLESLVQLALQAHAAGDAAAREQAVALAAAVEQMRQRWQLARSPRVQARWQRQSLSLLPAADTRNWTADAAIALALQTAAPATPV
ncbi:MAG: hypothetical protein Q8K45_05785 [Rubrivivax sp.]|nr:hypothetical protein [Rubrivivax sp.]